MKNTLYVKIMIFAVIIIMVSSACIKKIDPVLRYARQEKRKETGDNEWWLSEDIVTDNTMLIPGFYKQNPDLYSLLSWELYISKHVNALSPIHWIVIHQYINILTYITVEEFTQMAKTNPTARIPDKFSFLLSKAKELYLFEDIKIPDSWTIRDVCFAFLSPEEFVDFIKTYKKSMYVTQEGKLLINGLKKSDSDEFEAKLTIRFPPKYTDISRKSIFKTIESFLNDKVAFPGDAEKRIIRDSVNSISLHYIKQPSTQNAFLSFHLKDNQTTDEFLEELNLAEDKTAFIEAFKEKLPPGVIMMNVVERDEAGFPDISKYGFIEAESLIDNTYIISAQVQIDNITLQPSVTFQFSPEGAALFHTITTEHEGETISLVYKNFIVFSASISEPIKNGRVMIRGQGISMADANDIADYLNGK